MPIIASAIITTPEAKAFLNIDDTDSDIELGLFINAASQMITNRIGVVSDSPTVDEWHDGGSERIMLRNQAPIQSVTTVTETYGTITYTLAQVTLDAGGSANAYAYSVDLDRGLLVRRTSGVAAQFASGVRNVHVTYVAGYATIPEDIKHAAKLLVKHLWETQRGGGRRPGADSGASTPGSAFMMPNRVMEILDAHTVPGIA